MNIQCDGALPGLQTAPCCREYEDSVLEGRVQTRRARLHPAAGPRWPPRTGGDGWESPATSRVPNEDYDMRGTTSTVHHEDYDIKV